MHARTQSPAQPQANPTAAEVISNATVDETAEILVPMLKKSAGNLPSINSNAAKAHEINGNQRCQHNHS